MEWLYLFQCVKEKNHHIGKVRISNELLECLVLICEDIPLAKNTQLFICLLQMCTKYQLSPTFSQRLNLIFDKTLPIILEEQPDKIKIIRYIIDEDKESTLEKFTSITKFFANSVRLGKYPSEHEIELYNKQASTTDMPYFKWNAEDHGNVSTKLKLLTIPVYGYNNGVFTQYLINRKQLYDLIIGDMLRKNDNGFTICFRDGLYFKTGRDNRTWIRIIVQENDMHGNATYGILDILDVIDTLIVFLKAACETQTKIPIEIIAYMLTIFDSDSNNSNDQATIISELKQYMNDLNSEHCEKLNMIFMDIYANMLKT